MTAKTTTYPGGPPAFPNATAPLAIRSLELAGWGGGPGMVFAKHFTGDMRVTTDGSGLLRVQCAALVLTDRWTADALGATDSTPVPQGVPLRDEKRYLRLGTVFFTHTSNVRVMGQPPAQTANATSAQLRRKSSHIWRRQWPPSDARRSSRR